MTEYLLVVQFCSWLTGECSWGRAGLYGTEQNCVMHGLGFGPPSHPMVQFKCVMQAKETIPLPKPRPNR